MNDLQVIIRTPRREVVRTTVRSMRVLSDTGQVGLRPRMEPVILAVEPGLAILHTADTSLFVGTAGGLVRCDGLMALLLTPLAVAAEDEQAVIVALTQRLDQPSAEMEVRNMINNIQSNILNELKEDRRSGNRRVEVI
jgi:F0F1-type ATP synthase epsilon subunit